MNLLLIFGGMSYEHEISIKSFLNIYTYLDQSKYHISVIYITKAGEWLYLENKNQILNGNFIGRKVVLSPDAIDQSIILLDTLEKIKIDLAFPVLHGKNGEDGAIQGLFELAKIPYVGCGIAASANSLDKALTKTMISQTSVKQNPYIIILKQDFDENVIEQQTQHLVYPLFVKCASGGSSVGVYKATHAKELITYIKEAFLLDHKVLIEQGIIGREVEVAVLGNSHPIASTVGEITSEDFYTFDAKYVDNSSTLSIPAKLSEELIEQIRQSALTVYKTLGCRGLSRVDFFVTANGAIVFNEINTLPGFTNISMYPKLFEYVGIPYSNLLDKLIDFGGETIG